MVWPKKKKKETNVLTLNYKKEKHKIGINMTINQNFIAALLIVTLSLHKNAPIYGKQFVG